MNNNVITKQEKDITDALQNKINIINTSIDHIVDEVYNIQLYKNLLNDFILKHSNELHDEFKSIVNKIDSSIEIINSKSYLLEVNKLTKIVKTNSGNFVEISTPMHSPKTKETILLNNEIYENTKTNNDEHPEYIQDIELINEITIDVNKINFNVNNYENKKILAIAVYEIFLINVDLKK